MSFDDRSLGSARVRVLATLAGYGSNVRLAR